MEDLRSEWFELKVRVHHSSVLTPLLFAIVLDKITKDTREGIPKESLCANDLVFLGDCWSEVEIRHSGTAKHRKAATKDLLNTAKFDKGLQINLLNTAKND